MSNDTQSYVSYGKYKEYVENPIIGLFLSNRGLTARDIDYLVQPQVSHQHNPFLLKGVGRWIDQLYSHKGQTMAIIPDYDTDGVLSGTLARVGLYLFGFGDVYIYPPKTRDGYGLTRTSIDNVLKARPGTTVIITTDNGSNAHDGIAYAKSKGLTVLVTDHHVAQDPPPADAVVNPNGHGDTTYPFTHISGTAVIYKALTAYACKYVTDKQVMRDFHSLVLLVGISTISDVMPMLNENRYYVTQAVSMLSHFIKGHSIERIKAYDDTPLSQYYRGVDLLVMTLNRYKKLNYGVDADTFGFLVGPILNSPRRMVGESDLSFSLFQTNRDDLLSGRVGPPSDILYEMNELRKAHVQTLTAALFKHISKNDITPIDCAVFNARMGAGIAGLLSGKFTEKFGLPSVAFAVSDTSTLLNECDEDELINVTPPDHCFMTGSARSPESFNLYEFLSSIDSDHPGLIESWGGHPQAAGIKVRSENYESFRTVFTERLWTLIEEQLVQDDSVMDTQTCVGLDGEFVIATDVYDALVRAQMIQQAYAVIRTDTQSLITHDMRIRQAVQFFEQIAPFGQGFQAPTFSVAFSVRDVRVFFMGNAKQHVKFILPNGLTVIEWNGAESFQGDVSQDNRVVIATGSLSVNEFGGRESLQIVANHLVEVA